ncbi:glutamine amidotransferase [Tardibacter chloracetimidivorans]|uniref:Glutamine amidotransferase n=1 Tax=Tardibacter chloracetimidivorans TaxID=1921510 RepID=A0A1L3ZV03_9SPHN|nr:glutamine amidotransferase [Tardibacter chloracetimidivorans]API59455.1 glutamine amidotransferase [Tardibacter chloracetimidivorans]
MKSALVIRHVPYEDLAAFRAPISQAGYAIGYAEVDDAAFDGIDFLAPDLLILMGGPMGVYETDRHPWIPHELARLSARIAADRPTLGVCLGSQMMAAAMGADVYPGPVKEVGFAPVTLTDTGRDSPLGAVGDTPILHWHGDSFDLPENVALLASTPSYAHQAFARGPNILALQCHPEMDGEGLENWLAGADAYLASAGTDAPTIRADADRLGPTAGRKGAAVMRAWLEQLRPA